MEKKRGFLFLVFLILLVMPLTSAITFNPGTVLNTTSSNSSMTFSFAVNATNLTINPTSIYLKTVSYVRDGEIKTCLFIDHTAKNTNLASADFGCTGPSDITAPPSGGSSSTTQIPECSQNSDCNETQYCFEEKCYDAKCLDDSVCDVESGESCWNYQCVKLFDMEILEFESPVKVGEFFDFKYFLKAVAEINGDVEIKFWIEQDEKVVTSGQDTIYFSSFEEKTKTKKLFLPNDISSGTYVFYIEVTYGTYTASAHRTIGIEVEGGLATIRMSPDFTQYIIYGLIGLGIFIVFLIFYIERRKIKKGLIGEGRWIKKHRVSILVFLLFIILGVLIYYFKWYELIVNWILKTFL